MERETLNELSVSGGRGGPVPALALLTSHVLRSQPNFAYFSVCCCIMKRVLAQKICFKSAFVSFFPPLFFLIILACSFPKEALFLRVFS